MPNVNQMIHFISQRFMIDGARAKQSGRYAREAGYLSQAGYGRGAAKATPRDAASMIIALMLANWVPTAAPRYIVDYGNLRPADGTEPALFGKYPPSPTLLKAIADLIERLGSAEFAMDMVKHSKVHGPLLSAPLISIKFNDSHLNAAIKIGDWEVTYVHESVSAWKNQMPFFNSAGISQDERLARNAEAVKWYYRGFSSWKVLDQAELIAIADYVNEASFWELVKTARQELRNGAE